MMRFFNYYMFLFYVTVMLTGCAGITPRNQSVNFMTSATPTISNVKSIQSKTGNKTETKTNIDKNNQASQENYQSVQNGLLQVTGKLAEIKADVGKALELNSKITGLEGDIAALKADQINIKSQMKAEIEAEVRAQVQSEISGIKTTFNNNSNLPFSFMAGLVLIVVVLGGGLIFVIYQNSIHGKVLKSLSETTPLILPILNNKTK